MKSDYENIKQTGKILCRQLEADVEINNRPAAIQIIDRGQKLMGVHSF